MSDETREEQLRKYLARDHRGDKVKNIWLERREAAENSSAIPPEEWPDPADIDESLSEIWTPEERLREVFEDLIDESREPDFKGGFDLRGDNLHLKVPGEIGELALLWVRLPSAQRGT